MVSHGFGAADGHETLYELRCYFRLLNVIDASILSISSGALIAELCMPVELAPCVLTIKIC